ncbi:methyltransferase [Actinokineospora sp. NBRC 105648]|uniref:methyltransferase n=1 Tax=Actinokineospora sp. NBRC 105648 TaxID=3032206 RepID=UPI0024A2A42B|nr:methyltransferase [Actinokineospora sp. NBRC 105648]GLZ36629.1 methyltransferase [Actinokineospora sp. NBRC 105648]
MPDATSPALDLVTPDGPVPARLKLMLLANGQRFTAVVHTLAELGVADVLAGGPLPVSEIADKVGCDPTQLHRVLRFAALLGLFREVSPEVFSLTELAEGLREDVQDSVRDAILLDGSERFNRAFTALTHSVRTGKPAFDHVHGLSFWDYLASDTTAGRIFDAAMTGISRRLGTRYLERHDFGQPHRIADIGGGRGYFLASLLERYPEAQGVLFDRPSVVAGASLRDVGDRAKIVGGDFFTDPLPTGCDTYILKMVLHDWTDEAAGQLLQRLRKVVTHGARLLILEQVVLPMNSWDPAKLLDLDMMVIMGGRERSLNEWQRLLEGAGFRLTHNPPAGDWTILECV